MNTVAKMSNLKPTVGIFPNVEDIEIAKPTLREIGMNTYMWIFIGLVPYSLESFFMDTQHGKHAFAIHFVRTLYILNEYIFLTNITTNAYLLL